MEGGRNMSHPLTRREAVKSMAGAAAWASMTGRAPMIPAGRRIEPKIGVKVPPPGPRSLALLERTRKSLGRTNYAGLYSICLGDGDGCYIQDLDGNVYLDCLAAASSNILGYGRDEVARAYFDTASRMQHSCLVYSINEPAIRLAEALNRLVPFDVPKKTILGLLGLRFERRRHRGRPPVHRAAGGRSRSAMPITVRRGFPKRPPATLRSTPDSIRPGTWISSRRTFPSRPRTRTGS